MLNKQEKHKKGQLIGRGIQWTDATWNPIKGCFHGCEWEMQDGSIAECYAKTVAEKFTAAYPEGFENYYFKPQILMDPKKVKGPLKIFAGSMTDLLGHWIEEDDIERVLEVMKEEERHTFQILTKNPTRLKKFFYPDNVWLGASSPPDFMWSNKLSHHQKEQMLHKTLLELSQFNLTRWMSIEPLSWDISYMMSQYPPLDWAVIGAATNGPKVYQPDPEHVSALLEVFDSQKVPVFFKGNLWGNEGIGSEWREYFPGFERSRFMDAQLGKNAMPV